MSVLIGLNHLIQRMILLMSRKASTVSTPHSAITATATSVEINCCGYNSLLIHWVSSATDKTWTIQVLGAMTTGATFVEWITSAGASVYTTDVVVLCCVTGILISLR